MVRKEDEEKRSAKACVSAEEIPRKKAYASPCLIEYGDLGRLTRGSTASGKDLAELGSSAT